MAFLKKIIIKSNGNIRPWVRNVFFTEDFQPIDKWRFLLCDKDNELRPIFQFWHQRVLRNPSYLMNPDWSKDRLEHLSNLNGKVSHLKIITPKITLYVAKMLQWQLSHAGVDVQIMVDEPDFFEDVIYIVICPQVFQKLPPRHHLIFFQMEQWVASEWFTEDYLNKLYNSVLVFDYSESNIKHLNAFDFLSGHVSYYPITPVPRSVLVNDEFALPIKKTIDVIFYGHTNSLRRKKYIKAIGNEFNLCIVSNLYGEKLWTTLLAAKIVINIHNYENALLETTRLSECLSLGLHVISELSTEPEIDEKFSKLVHFTPIGDINSMVSKIRDLLSQVDFDKPNRGEFSSNIEKISLHFIKNTVTESS